MDSVIAQLLSRLNMFLQQELDFQVDTQRFAAEPEYAAQVLDLIDEMGDYEFHTVATQIRTRQLALFSLKSTSAPNEVSSPSVLASDENEATRPRKDA